MDYGNDYFTQDCKTFNECYQAIDFSESKNVFKKPNHTFKKLSNVLFLLYLYKTVIVYIVTEIETS